MLQLAPLVLKHCDKAIPQSRALQEVNNDDSKVRADHRHRGCEGHYLSCDQQSVSHNPPHGQHLLPIAELRPESKTFH